MAARQIYHGAIVQTRIPIGPTAAALTFLALASVEGLGAQTFDLIYTFTGQADGGTPLGSLLMFPNFVYGTTSGGGAHNAGTVFAVNTSTFRESVLHSFAGGPGDGAAPFAGLVRDDAGDVYGVTYSGGEHFRGIVFEIAASSAYSVLHNFTGRPTEGAGPAGTLAIGSSGKLYGTTYGGGARAGWGSVFRIDDRGDFATLQSFPPDGALPRSGLVLVGNDLYGTTTGGADRHFGGTLYQVGVKPALHEFTGGADGAQPLGGLTADTNGNLYGTTSDGGSGSFGAGDGVVFKFTPATKQLTVLHTFQGTDGATPAGTLARDAAGNLFGTTMLGGAYNHGTVFRLEPSGNLTTLYSFQGLADGATPFAGVILDNFGNLWGVASAGGASGYGTLFEIVAGP